MSCVFEDVNLDSVQFRVSWDYIQTDTFCFSFAPFVHKTKRVTTSEEWGGRCRLGSGPDRLIVSMLLTFFSRQGNGAMQWGAENMTFCQFY